MGEKTRGEKTGGEKAGGEKTGGEKTRGRKERLRFLALFLCEAGNRIFPDVGFVY